MTKAITPTDVLPPESQIAPSGSNLEDLGKQVRHEFEQWHGMENEAAWRGLRIGLMLIKGKRDSKHGHFDKWLKEYVPEISRGHITRLMSLSFAFIQKRKLEEPRAFLLCGEIEAKPDAATKKVEHVARAFVGNKTLNDLFDEHGIKSRKPKGGGPGRKTGEKITEAMRAESDAAAIRGVIDQLHTHVLKGKRYARCNRALIENLYDTLMDAKERVQGVIAKMK